MAIRWLCTVATHPGAGANALPPPAEEPESDYRRELRKGEGARA